MSMARALSKSRLGTAISRGLRIAVGASVDSQILSVIKPGDTASLLDFSDFDRYMASKGPELAPTDYTAVAVVPVSRVQLDATGVNFVAANTGEGAQYDVPSPPKNSGQYEISFTVSNFTAGSARVILYGQGGAHAITPTLTANGTYRAPLPLSSTGGSATNRIIVQALTTTTTLRVSAVSVRELTALDTATLFSDAAGTTPLTSLESAMGAILDASKGRTKGPNVIPTLDFTQWSPINAGTAATNASTFTTTAGGGMRLNGALTVGRRYEVTMTMSTTSANGCAVFADSSQYTMPTGTNTRTFHVTSDGTGFFYLRNVDAGTTTVTALSVRELPGNHASQSTAAARMVLSSRVNLLLQTENLADAAWTKVNATIAAASNGHARLVPGTTSADHYIIPAATTSVAAGQTITGQAILKAAGYSRCAVGFSNNAGWGTNAPVIQINLADGTIHGVSGDGNPSATVTEHAPGEWLVTWKATAPQNLTTQWRVFCGSNTAGQLVFAGDGTSGVEMKHPQWELGTTATRYQRVTTATDYDTAGFPVYAKADGVDDAAVITFPADQGAVNTIVRTAPGGVIEWLENQTIGTTYSITGTFHEHVIFPRALTVAEKNAVQAQLASPLGIAATPFKEPVAPANVAAPTITGDDVVGAVATLGDGTWIGEPAPTLTRQVQRYSAGAWADIAGATGTSYTYEFDGAHRLKVTGSNGVGPAVVAYSAEVVVGTTANPPTLVTAPIMSGNAYTGSTVYTLPGSWDGAGTLTYAYQPQYRATSTDVWANFGSAVANFVPDAVGEYSCLVTATGDGGVSQPQRSNTMKVSQAPVVVSAIDKTFTGAGVDTEVTTFDTSLAYFANPNATESLIVKAATNSVHANNNSGSMQGVYPTARALGDRQVSKVTIYQTDAGSQAVAFVRGVDYSNILWVQAGTGGASLIQKVGGVTTDYPLGTAFANGDVIELEISADGTTASVRRNGAHTTGGTWPSPITLTTVQPAGGVAGAGLWSSTTTEAGSFTRFIVDDFTAAPAAPSLDYAPRIIGDLTVNATLQTTYGVWFGAPEPTYAILWQRWDGAAWVAAGGTNNAVNYTPTIAGDYRTRVTATNSEGTTVSFSPSVTVAGDSVGTGNYVSGRVIIDDTNGAPEPIIARIEFLSGGTPLTGTASASSEAGAQYAAANANDADAATVWSSMLGIDESPYYDLTFTAPSAFTQVAITAANLEGQDGSAAPRSIRIQGNDGTTRTTLLTIENTTGWAPGERRVFNL